MYRVKVEPMPGNPASNYVGDKSGLWRIVIEDLGTGSIIPRNPPRQIIDEDMGYDEAFEQASKIRQELSIS